MNNVPLPLPEKVFNTLSKHVHHVNESHVDELPLFHDVELYNNDAEYWLFSDLYNLFGSAYVGEHKHIQYTMSTAIKSSNFEKLPKKNLEKLPKACDLNTFRFNHVLPIINNYNIQDPNGNVIFKKKDYDAKLSRYACWALTKLSPNMIFSQLYFMMLDATFEEINRAAWHFSRIYHRNNLAQAEKVINGIANQYPKTDMQAFNAFMHNKFFCDYDVNALKTTYGVKGTIFDYMGTLSLIGRYNALNKTISAYDAIPTHKTGPKISFDEFICILSKEIDIARKSMPKTPASDLSRIPVSQVATELKKKEREFAKKFAYQKLR